MNINQDAFNTAMHSYRGVKNPGYSIGLEEFLTTYLTEINKTHVIMPRKLGLMDFRNAIYSAGLITVSALWASQIYDELIDAADALSAGGK